MTKVASNEVIFPGRARDVIAEMPRAASTYIPAATPARVKHRAGYAPFVDFLLRHGREPTSMASNAAVVVTFCYEHVAEFSDEELAKAASIFFGNVLAHSRPDAEWMEYEGQPATVGSRRKRFEVEHLVPELANADSQWVAQLLVTLRRWINDGG